MISYLSNRLGTLAPFFRASESPMAIACSRLFTFFPLPDLSVPFFLRCIALSTRFDAAFPYFRPPEDFFRAMLILQSGSVRNVRLTGACCAGESTHPDDLRANLSPVAPI